MFDIDTDLPTRGLSATLQGQWDEPTAARYVGALRTAAERLGAGRSYWLIDASRFPVQPRAVAERIEAGLRGIGAGRHDAIAFVNASALMALQAKRLAPDSGHRLFASVADGTTWLDEQRHADL